MIRTFYIFLLAILAGVSASSQAVSYSLPVKMNGYIMNLGGEILFQPVQGVPVDFWNSLDNRSFRIWCNEFSDQYCAAIDGLGDSVLVRCYNSADSTSYNIMLRYFSCELEINMGFLDSSKYDFKVFDRPQYQINFKGKKYPAKGFFIRETVISLIPKKKEYILAMRSYYRNKGMEIPAWLRRTTGSR